MRVDGVLIPAQAEVAWILPEGRYPDWRGQVECVAYDGGDLRTTSPPLPSP